MVRNILAVMLVAGLAFSASAYDYLYTGDTAMTHDAGTFGIKGQFVYLMANSSYDQDGEKQDWGDDDKYTMMAVPINIYYAVMDNFEIGVQPKFLMLKEEYEMMVRETDTCEGSGIGDTWFYAKYMFMPEPMMTARLGVKLNTGEDEPDEGDLATGDGQMDIDAAIMFGMPAGPGMFDAAVGYRYRMAREFDVAEARASYEVSPGNEIHFAACYTYYLSDMMNLRFGADGFFGSDMEYSSDDIDDEFLPSGDDTGSNAVWINPGFDYMMENGMSMGLDVHYPLMGTNIYALWGVSAYVAWGSM